MTTLRSPSGEKGTACRKRRGSTCCLIGQGSYGSEENPTLADRTLYAAKANGRNRVEVAGSYAHEADSKTPGRNRPQPYSRFSD